MFLKKFVVQNQIFNKYVLVKYNSNYMANSIIPYKKLALKPNWVKAVKEAEKFCGFSNSLWSLSCFKTDEMATYITHRLEKFGSDDPTFTTAKWVPIFWINLNNNNLFVSVISYPVIKMEC